MSQWMRMAGAAARGSACLTLFGQDDAAQWLGKEAQTPYAAKDQAAAMEWAEAGAQAGSSVALVVPGQMYDLGNGVPCTAWECSTC